MNGITGSDKMDYQSVTSAEKLIRIYLDSIKDLREDYCKVGFVKVTDLSLLEEADFKEVGFLRLHQCENKDKLKQDLLKNGMMFPIYITPENKVTDGRHRFTCFKELVEEGTLPLDFKILCVMWESRSLDPTIACHVLCRTEGMVENKFYPSMRNYERKQVMEGCVKYNGKWYKVIKSRMDLFVHLECLILAVNLILREIGKQIEYPWEVNNPDKMFGDMR